LVHVTSLLLFFSLCITMSSYCSWDFSGLDGFWVGLVFLGLVFGFLVQVDFGSVTGLGRII
jgi:hypothetical protein